MWGKIISSPHYCTQAPSLAHEINCKIGKKNCIIMYIMLYYIMRSTRNHIKGIKFMKNTIKLFGIIAFIVIIGSSFVACSNDTTPEQELPPTVGPLDGTWLATIFGDDFRFTFSGSNYLCEVDNISGWENSEKGTFTIIGTTININRTNMWNGSNWGEPDSSTETGTITINPTSFIISGGSNWDGTYTKQ